jgi:hypothetical protein
MKRAQTILAIAVIGAAILAIGARSQTKNDALRQAGLSAEARAAILTVGDDVRKLEKSHQNYVKAAEELSGLFAKLSEKAKEVGALSAATQRSPGKSQDELFKAILEMQKMQESFNIQFLALQNDMQKENRQYTMVSNIMKTKHDTSKAAIRNIR